MRMMAMVLFAIVAFAAEGVSEATPPEHPLAALAQIAEAQGVETTTLEEALYQRMLDGDLIGAREGFKVLLDRKLEWLKAMRVQSPRNIEELARQGGGLKDVVQTFKSWLTAGVLLRLKGEQTPDPVLGDILAALRLVKDHADVIVRSAKDLLDPESRKRHPGKEIHMAIELTGELFLLSVAFLRETSQAQHRRDLLSEAKRYVPAPNTIEEFDARYKGDLRKEFGFGDVPADDEPGRRK